METRQIVEELEREIARLQQVRDLLSGSSGSGVPSPKRGGRRKLSAEARAKIAAAQKKRWAKQKAAGK